MPYRDELKRISLLQHPRRQIELAALISELFERKNIQTVIVGGAAVEFYTQGNYTTHDIDMVLAGDTKRDVESVMYGLGFKRTINLARKEGYLKEIKRVLKKQETDLSTS